jgi:hypothetical protein
MPNGSATALRGKPNTTSFSSPSFGSGEGVVEETPRGPSVSASLRVVWRPRPSTRVRETHAWRLAARAPRVARGGKDRPPDARVATERLFDAGETQGAFDTANAPVHRITTVDIAAPENTARGVVYTPARVRRRHDLRQSPVTSSRFASGRQRERTEPADVSRPRVGLGSGDLLQRRAMIHETRAPPRGVAAAGQASYLQGRLGSQAKNRTS